jgi:hypothetical protein
VRFGWNNQNLSRGAADNLVGDAAEQHASDAMSRVRGQGHEIKPATLFEDRGRYAIVNDDSATHC